MKPLEDYVYRDDQGKDLGINGTDPPPSLSLSYYYYFLFISPSEVKRDHLFPARRRETERGEEERSKDS